MTLDIECVEVKIVCSALALDSMGCVDEQRVEFQSDAPTDALQVVSRKEHASCVRADANTVRLVKEMPTVMAQCAEARHGIALPLVCLVPKAERVVTCGELHTAVAFPRHLSSKP
eukprot:CAMPEP_0181258402 /NCGR_PEP_ID=MMETSP1096-20121128/50762_1 /TAXON_ID=156174 ORGANISM="Chrysochromulina ericina, Strain CCMP281" /NCGR_SAMPLE_ID=MMETSP1096 /ASSEMBLY_ACC=CAM_ASM_000453 /LENGTH=114 /DNA_ID=CAMNT_0023356791 /DNA_START=1029 /DNA_END=1374 /DNA_ORIENTATION=+